MFDSARRSRRNTALGVIVVFLAVVATLWFYRHSPFLSGFLGTYNSYFDGGKTVTYACNDDKSIVATYMQGDSDDLKPAPGEPPMPTGQVSLKLIDGRTMTLHQTISASGIRYSDGNPNVQGSETFVFWSKGNGALVLENNEEKSYIGCIAIPEDPGGLPKVYHNGSEGFTVRYPANYLVNGDYAYQALGPGRDIHGVKFTIPASMATGTNLSSYDTGVSVEEIPAATSCTPDLFLDNVRSTSTVSENGVDYLVGQGGGAGAGNLYEETVYAIPGTNPCVAVRYLIHSMQIGNYPEGTVTAFDRDALMRQFDAIRRTLTLVP